MTTIIVYVSLAYDDSRCKIKLWHWRLWCISESGLVELANQCLLGGEMYTFGSSNTQRVSGEILGSYLRQGKEGNHHMSQKITPKFNPKINFLEIY
jgi:hypothetical protein